MDSTDDKGEFPETNPGKRSPVIRLGGSVLGPPRHICAFFNSHDDEYRVLLPFIKDGFECGEKAVHTVEPKRVDEHLERLATAGVDLAAAWRSGQFALRSWADANLRNQASV